MGAGAGNDIVPSPEPGRAYLGSARRGDKLDAAVAKLGQAYVPGSTAGAICRADGKYGAVTGLAKDEDETEAEIGELGSTRRG
jgi:hypothetical protein